MPPCPLKVGLIVPFGLDADGKTQRWNEIIAMARHAEAAGFDSLWFPEHLFFDLGAIAGNDEERLGLWDCWSILTALGAVTTRVQIGTFVACTNFRNPALLAKMADTVDEITGGRLILGLGGGYHEPEFRAYGYPTDHLVGRFEEALTIIHSLLRNNRLDFEGKYYTVRDCELQPRALRQGGPPILVGARKPRMLRLAARFADYWNTSYIQEPDKIAEERQKVDAACAKANRDPATLQRTVGMIVDLPGAYAGWLGDALRKYRFRFGSPVSGPPEEIASRLRAISQEGVGHVQLFLEPNTMAGIDAFAPVLESLRRE